MRPYERIVFLLLLVTFPLQLGKHFWPDFAFVQGIRLDYLSPTLYLSDILCVVLFLISFNRIKTFLWAFVSNPWSIFFFGVIIVSGIQSFSPSESFYSLVKLFEFLFLGIFISVSVKEGEYSSILFPFILGGLTQIVISFLQFITQRSLGGIFYYLGERTFDTLTPGIALFRLGEELALRPYGTFSHPNVLACYLFVTFIMTLFSKDFRTILQSRLRIILLFIIGFGIVLTFSRVIIILLALSLLFYFRYNLKAFILSSVGSMIVLASLSSRFENGLARDFLLRSELLYIAAQIFLKSPIYGVGLNNFYYHEILYQKTITPILLQPVHNIYAFTASSIGLLGLYLAVFFFYRTIRNSRNEMITLLMVSFLIIGMFDHYLLTLQQGQLLLVFVVGLSYSQLNKKTRERG